MNINTQKQTDLVIFALNLTSTEQELDEIRTLLQVEPLQAQGCYKGETENSYIVTLPAYEPDYYERFAQVCKLARRHNQESILLIDKDRNCTLYFLNPATFQPIGKLVPVLPVEALDHSDAWTRVGNQFYVVK